MTHLIFGVLVSPFQSVYGRHQTLRKTNRRPRYGEPPAFFTLSQYPSQSRVGKGGGGKTDLHERDWQTVTVHEHAAGDGETPLSLLQPEEFTQDPGDDCRSECDDDETDGYDVEFGKFGWGQGEGHFREEEGWGEE